MGTEAREEPTSPQAAEQLGRDGGRVLMVFRRHSQRKREQLIQRRGRRKAMMDKDQETGR